MLMAREAVLGGAERGGKSVPRGRRTRAAAAGAHGGVHTTYVEVKASALSDKALFEFSHNEFLFAQQAGDDYHIYRVLSAWRADARIVRIVNPYLQFRTQRIGLCITL
ncbi:hypothetical protein FOA52_010763 [Chlamydomonas sp. UWO 241]|nr:hypothetical protein FOA52_010763 [Chlamydomonas sp. UWO 241]